ncbi:carboxypeptidase B-like [Penaeus japonicus]|uniref:carboxypeptidase B-like n=1 Tax=Penaeus japonicus TaxID=27405 RepID=UPI001C710D2B|nr:carboxypeptidase B-like [Penaeus japonicus]
MRTAAVIALLGLVALASATDYHRYKVVSVVPRNAEDATVVRRAVAALQLEQWTDPRAPGLPVDVMVPPKLVQGFLNGLRIRGIPNSVKINDVQALIDEQMATQRSANPNPRKFDHTSYHTLDQIYSILDAVESDFSDMVSTYTAGTTYEGRPIRAVKISSGSGDNKEVVWIDCGIHAREWIAPATCQWIMDKLTSGYGSDSEVTELLDSYDFHIMPSVNPDGYTFTHNSNRLWRKNRVPYGSLGCHGTDPNRNFDSDFGGPGTSNSPCSDIYHGPSAFSEAESQAVRDSVQALASQMKVFFTIHSYSQLWMTPYGYTSSLPANYDDQYRVSGVGVNALTAVHGTRFQYGNIADTIYPAAGGSSDWAYDSAGVQMAFALELRDTGNFGFLLPADQIVPVGEETWAGIVAAIKAI